MKGIKFPLNWFQLLFWRESSLWRLYTHWSAIIVEKVMCNVRLWYEERKCIMNRSISPCSRVLDCLSHFSRLYFHSYFIEECISYSRLKDFLIVVIYWGNVTRFICRYAWAFSRLVRGMLLFFREKIKEADIHTSIYIVLRRLQLVGEQLEFSVDTDHGGRDNPDGTNTPLWCRQSTECGAFAG